MGSMFAEFDEPMGGTGIFGAIKSWLMGGNNHKGDKGDNKGNFGGRSQHYY